MPLPILTDEQRKQALAKAAEARKARAELKGHLKSEKMTLRDVLAKQGDDIVGKMKVSSVLESLPGVGKVRARKIMERIEAGGGTMRDLDTLLDIGEQMTGKTICVLSDSCAVPVISGIQKWRHEFEAHITGKRCPFKTASTSSTSVAA